MSNIDHELLMRDIKVNISQRQQNDFTLKSTKKPHSHIMIVKTFLRLRANKFFLGVGRDDANG